MPQEYFGETRARNDEDEITLRGSFQLEEKLGLIIVTTVKARNLIILRRAGSCSK